MESGGIVRLRIKIYIRIEDIVTTPVAKPSLPCLVVADVALIGFQHQWELTSPPSQRDASP